MVLGEYSVVRYFDPEGRPQIDVTLGPWSSGLLKWEALSNSP